MEIKPRKEMEALLRKVKAQTLVKTMKSLDQQGREIMLRGLTEQLNDSKKQQLIGELRAITSKTDQDVRIWLSNAISESYLHGMNYTTQLSSIDISGTPLYKWSDATPEVDTMWEKIRAIAGDKAGTVGDGVYFSLDSESSKDFGNTLHSYSLPEKYKLLDTTKNQNLSAGGVSTHPIEKRALLKGVDVVEQAKREGYDGVIFMADDGQNKWVALNNETAKVALLPIVPKIKPLTVELLKNSAEFSPHLSAVNAMLSDAYLDFGNAMNSFVKSGERMINDALKKQVRDTLMYGRLDGESIKDIKSSVKEAFVNKGFIGLTDRNGREWTIDRYSEMLTRTHIMKANNEGAINRARDFDVDIVEISDHGSTCPICSPYEGKLFSLSGSSKKYPSLDGNVPPFHPNCKHSLLYRPDLGDDRE